MAYNKVRTTRFQQLSVEALKRFVDAKTLSSAAARAELARRGIVYFAKLRE